MDPICLAVRFGLHNEFRRLVSACEGCKVINVIELLTCKMLEYWVECPEEKKELITEFAFMTWIKNPEFQKHYLNDPSFIKISEQWKKEKNLKMEYTKNGQSSCLKWMSN